MFFTLTQLTHIIILKELSVYIHIILMIQLRRGHEHTSIVFGDERLAILKHNVIWRLMALLLQFGAIVKMACVNILNTIKLKVLVHYFTFIFHQGLQENKSLVSITTVPSSWNVIEWTMTLLDKLWLWVYFQNFIQLWHFINPVNWSS